MSRVVDMGQVKLSSENIEVIHLSVEQASSRLRVIEQGKRLLPMQYTARLSWEVLYGAREILSLAQQPRVERAHRLSHRLVTFSSDDLLGLAQSIEQVMLKLHQIEMEKDMAAMKVLAHQCQQELEGCLFGALNQRPSLLVADW